LSEAARHVILSGAQRSEESRSGFGRTKSPKGEFVDSSAFTR